MASAQVVETSVTNNSPFKDSYHPDDLFQSRYNTNSCFVVSIQLSLGGVFTKKKKLDGSCPEGSEYSTIVTFSSACYNARQVCLDIDLLSQSTHTEIISRSSDPISENFVCASLPAFDTNYDY